MGNEYWRKREEAQRAKNIADEAEYDAEIQKIYKRMLSNTQKEIDAFYGKYATKEGISMAEAKKRVDKLDIEAYSEKAKKYVVNRDLSPQANEEMRLYNLTMKVNRLEMLKANIGMQLVDGFSDLDEKFKNNLTTRTQDELERQAGILGKTVKNPSAMADSIVNASFNNATFSQRIWSHQELLKFELNKQLQSGLISGKNPRDLARSIQRVFGSSTYNAERLMRTELARVQTDAQAQSYERNGFAEYEFLALGSSACEICRALDGKHFKVDKMLPGENAPPMHPNCRCSTGPWMDDKAYNEWLDLKESGRYRGSFDFYRTGKVGEKSEAVKRPEPIKKEPIAEKATEQSTKNEKRKWEDLSKENEAGQSVLESMYDANSSANNLSRITSRADDVSVKYDKISKETAQSFNSTLKRLGEKYVTQLTSVRMFSGQEWLMGKNTFAFVRHDHRFSTAELVLNPVKLRDFEALKARIRELSQSNYCVNVINGAEGEYIPTHEFAHSVINVQDILKNKNNFTNMNYKMVKSARKEISSAYDDYLKETYSLRMANRAVELKMNNVYFGKTTATDSEMAEMREEYNKTKAAYNAVLVSRDSLDNADEFAAECFTDAEIGVSPSKYSLRIKTIYDKYFGR